MSRWEPITSIDIGNHSIKGVVVNDTNEGKEVVAYSTIKAKGIESGDIKDANALNESMENLIENLEEQVGKNLKDNFLISSSIGNFKFQEIIEELILVEGDNAVTVNEKHVEELRENVLKTVLGDSNSVYHSYIKKYILDGNKIVFNPVSMNARRLEGAYSFIIGDSVHRSSVDYATRKTIGEAEYFISPVSASEAVLTSSEKDSGVVHVDLGYHTTVVTVFLNNAPIRFERLSKSIKHVVFDIAKVLKTSVNEAERLLKIYGVADYRNIEPGIIEYKALDNRTTLETSRELLARIIYARLREIFLNVRKVYRNVIFDYSEFRDLGIPGGIVLTGGGAKILKITDVASDVLKSSVRVGSFVNIEEFQIEENEQILTDPQFAAVFGNILQYEKKENIEIFQKKSRKNSFGFGEILRKLFKGE
ncbi:cell division protein FtsA [Thermosipho melanesiensis]|uniref:Cell division protein FtsA n=2 Tax=Thermosipho melanesiensis TaxID=46541 RepID=A6LMH2_THEM4|nr:cell division protein FtsA [Thermosipho melanesiensis]ABR31123.1 cell division protein FtsA [Thermosipho melanesiensis BI429]APT74214.1 cell division protein FtsA [Thermosipho melanesiensis]OOC36160.1 cell division protein FtsA [Thermosipho melanesiensis]OOC36977.1 cell division protein FtsA [Thermosipho melanesiensis]OOC37729.1 cell division protein FtsA [Thermosipho melanesiensis]